MNEIWQKIRKKLFHEIFNFFRDCVYFLEFIQYHLNNNAS